MTTQGPTRRQVLVPLDSAAAELIVANAASAGPSSLVVSITEDLVRALEWVFKRLRVQFPPSTNTLTLWPCGSNIIWQPLGFLVSIIGVYHRTSEHYCCQDARSSNRLPRGQDPWILQGQVVRLVLIVSTMSGDTRNWDRKDRSI